MPRQITDPRGVVWTVTLSGRHTQYAKDEVSLAFHRDGETRLVRFSPRGAKTAESAYEEASDALLTDLLGRSQPSWTAPDAAYQRDG